MLKWFLGTLVGVVLGLVTYFSWYLGAFKPVNLVEKQVGPLQLIYKTHVGPYHKIVATLDEVEHWTKSNDIPCKRTFGEFLDNPEVVEEGRLRAHVGCVVDATPELLKTQLEKTPLPEGYEFKDVPARSYVTCDFEGSPGIGPMRVYPKAHDYFQAKHQAFPTSTLEIYEIHDAKSMTTTYLF